MQLGPFSIERELGRGGMGVVYLARDPRLDRLVAVKVLSDALGGAPDHLARFEREARLLASINHPNIAAIYGLEKSSDGRQLLVLEYIPGDTLAERLQRQALPTREALEVAQQIATALEAAHERGVIHRDLKPGNVKITPEGQVKVLDFGLAKAASSSIDERDLAQSPTFTSPATAIGVILGTAGYMSPEQARGRSVDKRTDIWSFGCVLYECLTGKRAFDGETVSDTIAQILQREPEWSSLPPDTPPRVVALVRRCLEKDHRRRQRDIGDVRLDLEDALAAGVSTPIAAIPSRRPQRAIVAAAGGVLTVAGALAGAAIWSATRGGDAGPAATPAARLSIAIPADMRVTDMEIAPDGQHVILEAANARATSAVPSQLFTRAIDSYDFKPITGSEGVRQFAISGDGRRVAIMSATTGATVERRIVVGTIDGSAPPVVVGQWDPSWLETITFLQNGDLLGVKNEKDRQVLVRLNANGGATQTIPLQLTAGFNLRALEQPLERSGLVFAQVDNFASRGYQTNIWLVDPASGAATAVIENAADPRYLDTGHLLFARDDAIMAAPFDHASRKITGSITALLGGLSTPAGPSEFGLATTGTLAYVPATADEFDRSLIVVTPDGRAAPFVKDRVRLAFGLSVTRDGRRAVATAMNRSGTYETWIADASAGTLRRAIAYPNADVAGGEWSPDGQGLVFTREALAADDGVYIASADGSASRRLAKFPGGNSFLRPDGWLPDGSSLVATLVSDGSGDIVLLPVTDGEATPRPLRATAANEGDVRVSPDGRLISFASDESGRTEIYVASFDKQVIGAPVPVTRGACGRSRWATARRLYFCERPGVIKWVDVTPGAPLSISLPVQALDLTQLRINSGAWDVLSDGRLVGVQRTEAEESIRRIDIVLGWGAEARRRLGSAR